MMEQEYNTGKNKPEYAVKPHHRLKRLGEGGPSMLKVRNILNLVFMALAVVGVVLYLQSEQHIIAPHSKDFMFNDIRNRSANIFRVGLCER